MPLLPYLGETEDTKWTKTQSMLFVILTYTIAVGFIVGLILAFRNLKEFIIGYGPGS